METSLPSLKLVIVDDDLDMCHFVAAVAKKIGFITSWEDSSKQFIRSYEADIDVVLLDLFMPDVDGIELLRFMAQSNPPKYLILISGADEVVLKSAQKLAEELGLVIIGILQKPFRKTQLEQLLHTAEITSLAAVPREIPHAIPTLFDLEQAIHNEEISVVFQPQVSCIERHKILGVEALARWHSPRLGNVPPLDFIPMAEQTGLISSIDMLVMRKAIAGLRELHLLDNNLSLSINMSANTFNNLALPELIVEQLEQHQIDPKHLSIEVTETALMRDLVKSLDILTRLRMKGVHLSIDDFGTGYSSMSQLVRIPFCELKIDGSFVEGAERGAECKAVVKASVMLGKELGMKVVAERVSSPAILALVTELGCDLAQGFYTGRPMPLDDLIEILSSQQRL